MSNRPEGAPAQRGEAASEDRELVLAFQVREVGAAESIYTRYRPMVRSICARILNDPNDVEEATQETFLRVLRALPSFGGEQRLRAWIARIARNVCIDLIRTTGRQGKRTERFEESDVEALQMDSDPQDLFMRNVEGSQIRRTLEAVPRRYRSAVILRDVYGLKYSEIAEHLSVPKHQVKNFLHRGRKAFRRVWMSNLTGGLVAPLRAFGDLLQSSRQAISRGPMSVVSAGTESVVAAVAGSGQPLLGKVAAATVAMVLAGSGASVSSPDPSTRPPTAANVGQAINVLGAHSLRNRAYSSTRNEPPLPARTGEVCYGAADQPSASGPSEGSANPSDDASSSDSESPPSSVVTEEDDVSSDPESSPTPDAQEGEEDSSTSDTEAGEYIERVTTSSDIDEEENVPRRGPKRRD